eukprot:s31_g18.t1
MNWGELWFRFKGVRRILRRHSSLCSRRSKPKQKWCVCEENSSLLLAVNIVFNIVADKSWHSTSDGIPWHVKQLPPYLSGRSHPVAFSNGRRFGAWHGSAAENTTRHNSRSVK